MITAYAVKNFYGQILLDTVYPTRRGAMANWLVAHCNRTITRSHNDRQTEMVFSEFSKKYEASVIRVEITELADEPEMAGAD